MNENVDIFICTHKDFEKKVTDKVYKVIDSRDLKNKFKIFGNLDDVELSEWYHLFYIMDNIELKDYVGICHYRRYFDFLDNVPNLDELFKDYEIVTRTPLSLGVTIKEQYEKCHNIEDLEILGEILKEKYQDYYPYYEHFLKARYFIPCNMLIMKKDDFIKFIKFVKEIIKEFFWITGTDVYERVLKNEEKYIKNRYPNNTHMYQIRLITFVLERLTNIYILKNFKKIKTYGVVITENKYGLKKNSI